MKLTASPSASLAEPGAHVKVSPSTAGDGAMLTLVSTGGVLAMTTTLESTSSPSLRPSVGVTVQNTASPRSKSLLVSVDEATPRSSPPTLQA